MWMKVCLLLAYILFLFILSRVLEALSWYENGYSGVLSRQLLDPMALSVAKLRALLEQRGVSYEGVVEKSELTNLVDSSGPASKEEVALAQSEGVEPTETNFTCGAHFIEQVEDAKDSVWLVQVVRHSGQLHIVGDMRWKTIRKKVTKFGVRTGLLDCSLDYRYCHQKGWHSPFLLLALPSEFEKKASIAMHNYSGPVHETVVLRWVRDKLAERVVLIRDPVSFKKGWQNFTSNPLDPEIRTVLFTQLKSPPLFYSALTVKFPGRVKFGMVSMNSLDAKQTLWKHILQNVHLPSYVIYSSERNYTYGSKPGEQFSFCSMEQFFKFLYPCLNDVFIISFCAANIMSLFEFFVSNCSICRRLTKCLWCIIKYNIVVIMLWLPIMGIFQMPFLDRVPLIALKLERIFSTSNLGTIFRGDYSFFQNHPVYIYFSFIIYLISVTYLCRKYRHEEDESEGWFNFRHTASLVHLRPNNLLEPMGLSGYDFLGRLDVLGSRLTPQSLWLQPSISSEYIQHLQTWRYSPLSLSDIAAENVKKVEMAMSVKSDPQTSGTVKVGQRTGVGEIERLTYNSEVSFDQHENERLNSSHTVFSPSETDQSTISTEADLAFSGRNDPCEDNQQQTATACGHLPVAQGSNIPQDDQAFLIKLSSTDANTPSPIGQATTSTGERHASAVISESVSVDETGSSTMSPTSSLEESRRAALGEGAAAIPSSSLSTTSTQGFPAGFIENHQCVICLDEYVPHVMLCGLPCGHVFHESCIIAWLNREKHFCPMCRWPSYQVPPGLS